MAYAPNSTLPAARPIGQALAECAPLARLQALLRESNARFDTIRPLLPPALASQVRPGGVDDEGWSLLADHAAAAAKLRQLLPRLVAALEQSGFQGSVVRVRVQPR